MLVEGEPVTVAENPPLSGRNVPVSSTNPVVRFSGVSVSGPSRQFDVALMIELLEDPFADDSPVIITQRSDKKLGIIKVSTCQCGQEPKAFFLGARLAHNRAAMHGRPLTRWSRAMAIGPYICGGEWLWVGQVRVEGQ